MRKFRSAGAVLQAWPISRSLIPRWAASNAERECLKSIDCKAITGQIAPVINRQQIRAARGLLGWTARELADASRLGIATIQRAESEKGMSEGNLYVIQHALED